MYDRIGGKIKGLAKALFIVTAIAEVITGFAIIANDEDMILLGFLVIVVGPIIAWISSWLLYGFGELIDKVSEIALFTGGNESNFEPQETIDSERINKIEMLRSQGLISEEEYQQAISKEQ